jgi:hypothetical protein
MGREMKKMVLLAALLMPLAASAATASDVVGKWVHVRFPSLRMEVQPNNGNYLVTVLKESVANQYVGQLKGGLLVVSVGPMESKADIDAKTGHLVFNGQAYRPLKAGESFEYKPKGVPKGW